jgi:acyl-CoA thioester hydrolase
VVSRLTLQPSLNRADYAFVHRLRTRFAETDAMGIIHHAAYLPYLEEARVAYLKAIGHPYQEVRGTNGKAAGDAGLTAGEDGREFPVLEASLHYRRSLQFDDEVEVSLVVGAVTRATFQIAYLLTVGGETRATAVTVHACVDRRGRPSKLPGWVRTDHAG